MAHRKHGARSAAVPWIVFVVVAALLGGGLWAGWSLLTHRTLLPSDGGPELTVGLSQAPASLDIRTESGTPVEQALLGNVYETLTDVDDDNRVVPGLASSWKVSSDGLTYDVTLRDGVRFSNGDALDAGDVVRSLQAAINEHRPGSDGLSHIIDVAGTDATHVRITLSAPDTELPRALSGRAGIVYDTDAQVDYRTAALGSGPFVVSDYSAGHSMTLVPNDRYWGQRPRASRITLRYGGDPAADVAAGRADLAVPDPSSVPADLGKDGVVVSQGLTTRKATLVFNNDTESDFSIRPLRQAMRYALDLKALVASQPDAAQPLGGPIGPLEPGYEDLTGLYPHDLQKMNDALAYFRGFSLYLNDLTFVVPSSMQSLGKAVADQLTAVGAGVKTEVLDDAGVAQRLQDRQFDMLLTFEDEGSIDSYASHDDSPGHYAAATDAEQQFQEAQNAVAEKVHEEGLRAFAKTVSEDAASAWLYVRRSVVVARKGVTGYPTNMTDRHLELARLDRA